MLLCWRVVSRKCNVISRKLSACAKHSSHRLLLQDNKDLYAEEAAAQRERERQRMLSIPGLIAPNEIQDEMLDS